MQMSSVYAKYISYKQMDEYCEHFVGTDDEAFLLDDENAFVKKCVRCRKQGSQRPVTQNGDNWNVNGAYNNTILVNINGSDTRLIPHEDEAADSLEDLPLLTNDSYDGEFHCHNVLTHHEDSRAWRKLGMALILCCLFMLTELVGGYIAGSLAIMTDAAHLFSDFVGFLISLLSMWIATKSPTKKMTFGYYRAEVLGAFFSVIVIWILAIVFAGLAIDRLWHGEYEIEADTMMIVAALGVVVNIVMGAVLHGADHNHGHGAGHNHSHGARPVNQPDNSSSNINVRAAAAHIIGDLIQSVGILIAAVVIKFFPQAKAADALCTLLFSIITLFVTINVAKDSVWLLLEASPKCNNELIYKLKSISDVLHVHNFHVWALSPGKNAVSVHLNVDKNCDREAVLEKATSLIKHYLNVISCTIQIELFNPEIVNSCKHCQLHQC